MTLLLSQHGRIKVRTTAEQAEAKRKEREKKLKIYKETTSHIYEKVYPTNISRSGILQIIQTHLCQSILKSVLA